MFNEKKQRIQVYIRLRPFLPHEEQEDVVEINTPVIHCLNLLALILLFLDFIIQL